jgi:anaerobic selenocysteine-containing dehydrogenase
MSEWSRREFLTVGATGAAGLALENKARLLRVPEKPWNARTERSLHKFRSPLPTACAGCESHCALWAYRDGDRVVQVSPNRQVPFAGAACARAYEALEQLYDAERVLRPLRRVGERGEGRWEEITWGQAMERIGRVLAADPGAAYVDVGCPDPLAGPLFDRLGITRRIGQAASLEWAAREAQRSIYGLPLARPDVSRAGTVLLVDARPLDGGRHFAGFARDLVAARARGAQVVAVGAYEGATGSVVDQWIPCRPGTSALFLVGLTRILLSAGWFDAEALSRTSATPVEKLLESLAPYTADLVGSAAGVPVAQLVELARRFAEHGPSLCVVDGAGTEQALALESAAALLNGLFGNPEQAGVRLAHAPEWLPTWAPTLPRSRAMKDILAGNERASLYWAYRTNPVYWGPRSDALRRAFADPARVELLVAMDTQLTETAALADLVLPAAADLELWNLLGGYAPDGKPYAVLQQPTPRQTAEARSLRRPDTPTEELFREPASRPLGEARQLGDALLEILALIGHPAREDFPYPDCGTYVRHLAESAPSIALDGGFERLSREGYWQGRTSTYPWADQSGFPTASRLVEVGDGLVHRVTRDLKGPEGDSFALVILSYPEIGEGYANTRWGREVRFQNPVYINAAVARKMGLSAGDAVVVRTGVGEARGRVQPIQGIHPEAVAVAGDFGHWAGGVAATASTAPTGTPPKFLLVQRENFLDNPLGVDRQETRPGETPWWHHYGPGISIPALSPFTSDDYGAQAWRDLRVTIHPA